jgi:hypothetical protein
MSAGTEMPTAVKRDPQALGATDIEKHIMTYAKERRTCFVAMR